MCDLASPSSLSMALYSYNLAYREYRHLSALTAALSLYTRSSRMVFKTDLPISDGGEHSALNMFVLSFSSPTIISYYH